MLIEIKDIENVFHIPEPWYIESCIFNKIQGDGSLVSFLVPSSMTTHKSH